MFQTNFVENENTNFMFNIFFLPKFSRYEKMCKNIVAPNRPQTVNTIPRMRFATWITKATDTH